MNVSIVIRTYNEARHLGDLLQGIKDQDLEGIDAEVVIVDSGSTDRTLEIAQRFTSNIAHIRKEEFSFGRSLNIGCEVAHGEAIVFISGHCIPMSRNWLRDLIAPLGRESVVFTYGSQRGNEISKFSECQLFLKYFPHKSSVPQAGFYCNNANAALLRNVWRDYKFNEEITGLEDMYLARKLVENGHAVGYVAEAAVYHLHDETWGQVKRRFEREAIALQHIMPEVHVSFVDFLRYFTSALFLDASAALEQRELVRRSKEIFLYRLMQFWGAYRGNHIHRQISRLRKEAYFYPR